MTSDLIEQVVSLYLYGSATPPSDLTADSLIRSDSATTSITMNASDYMTSSGGRFAKPSQFEVVTEFFSINTTLTAGTSYSLSQMLTQLALPSSAATANVDQKEYSGGTDYLERVFLFNNTSFAIVDNASLRFVVDANGTRHIQNLKIVPQTDNFDFTAGDPTTENLNDAVLPFIDPSAANNGPDHGLGRQVIINFSDTAPTLANYTQSNLVSDINYISGEHGSANDVYTLGPAFAIALNDLWEEEITSFLDGQDRPILYGTNGADALSASQIDSIYYSGSIITGVGTYAIDDLTEFKNNGVVLIGGGGNDTLQGGLGNNELYGGAGTDTAIFVGDFSDYTRPVGGASGITISALSWAETDILYQVEKLQFADGVYLTQGGFFKSNVSEDPIAEDDFAPVQTNGAFNINVLGNDSDPDGTALHIASVTAAAHGALTVYSDNTITYQANTGYTGADTFTYTVQNAGGLSDTGTVHVIVGATGSFGTNGNDTLNGTGSGDTIWGLDGNDNIDGSSGNDTLDGGNGDDIIYGGTGTDTISGGSGNDSLQGGSGSDTIYGGAGNDSFFGNDATENFFGGSGSDKYYFDMSADGGWAGINESDSQGADTVYLSHVSGGDRIEFQYSGSQLNASWFDSASGSADFSFSISGSNALSGKGVENIVIDGNKVYSTANIIAAAQAAGGTFVFDIDTYQSGGYPALLPTDSSGDINPVVANGSGGVSIFSSYHSSVSIEKKIYGQEVFHALTFDGQASPDPQTSTMPAIGYIKEMNLYNGISVEDVRLTVDSTENAALCIHLENVGVDYTYEYFENGYAIHGYSMSSSSYGSIGRVIGTNSISWTVYADDPLQWEEEQHFETYYFEALNFANGDSINLLGTLHFEGTEAADTLYGLDRADVISGYGGNDTIYGYGGNDILTGGAGYDQLQGGLGDDTYEFAAGFGVATTVSWDYVYENANEGTDTIAFVGGLLPGDVRSWTDSGGLHLRLSANPADELVATGSVDSSGVDIASRIERIAFDNGTVWNLTDGLELTDTDDAHTIYGSAPGDVIDGRGGNDTIYGYGGNDTLTGGAGYDQLQGGLGDDTYEFAAGFGVATTVSWDYVYENANEGTDTIAFVGGILPGDVRSWTDSGGLHLRLSANAADELVATGSVDSSGANIASRIERIAFDNGTVWTLTDGLELTDTDDAHTIYGSAQGDVIDGRGGNDTLYGYGGNDTLTGGAGSDTLDGGDGFDTASYSNDTAGIVINLATGTVTDGGGSTDYLYNIENITGSSHNDTITGSSGDNVLDGGLGNDTLNGSSGDDTFIYSAGLDTVSDSSGTDTLKFGPGITLEDISFASYAASSKLILNAGVDEVTLSGKTVEKLALDDGFTMDLSSFSSWVFLSSSGSFTGTGSAIDTVIGRAGAQHDNIKGGDGNDVLYGGDGSDYVYGNNGDDYVNGGDGNDTTEDGQLGAVRGGSGNDHVYGGAGNDFVDGESGDDFLYGGTGFNHLEGGSGNDVLYGGNDGISNDKEELWGESGKDTLYGGTGINEAKGGSGDDTIYGNVSDDFLYGGDGDDEIHGGDGNDTIRGEEGQDLLFGDAGNDDIRGGTDDNIIYGGDGNDIIFGGSSNSDAFAGNDRLYGGAGTDQLNGGQGNDILDGGDGNDTQLKGNGGDDSYIISAGVDYISDSDGTADRLVLGAGIDMDDLAFSTRTVGSDVNLVVAWGGGNTTEIRNQAKTTTSSNFLEQLVLSDGATFKFNNYANGWTFVTDASDTGTSSANTIIGNALAQTLSGEAGDDQIHAGGGNDTVNGGDGNDLLHGGRGNDLLSGDAGNDTLYGGEGNDDSRGGLDNDIYVASAGTDYITDDGGTADLLIFSYGVTAESLVFHNGAISQTDTDDLTIYWSGGANSIEIENQNKSSSSRFIETIQFDDGFHLNLGRYYYWLFAQTPGQTVSGDVSGDAADTIIGLSGNETLYGYDMNDEISGGAGNDTVYGGTGDDLVLGGTGNDTLKGEAGIDTIYGGDGDDLIYGGTLSSDTTGETDYLYGGAGIDTIHGGVGDDFVYGDDGDDVLRGQAGADTIYGGEGKDDIRSGDDNDTLFGDDGDDTIYGEAGNDTAHGGFGDDTLKGGDGIDTLYGDSGDDVIYGEAGVDALHGGAGNDTMWGANSSTDSTDNDTLDGDDGDDILHGQSGNDALSGGTGADILYGETGTDTLTGGADADTFVFMPGETGVDTVTDFALTVGEEEGDILDISDLLTGYTEGVSDITLFVRITDSAANSNVEVDRDGSGSVYAFAQVATLQSITGLTNEAALLSSGLLLAA